ncbi:MAG TPA: nuclease, partial [Blastocatellia bacterium]|nr:nuclease [Blastocatellia bacterium]
THLSATPPVLWPANHEMVPVTVDYALDGNCAATCTLSVSSNEPGDGGGDGHTSSDWQVLDAHHLLLRAERAGTGTGRIYTLEITCIRGPGESSTGKVTVTVPHDRGL